MVIDTKFEVCEDFEDYLYSNGLSEAGKYVVWLNDGEMQEHAEFNDMDIDSMPGGGIEITFTKSSQDGEDYIRIVTDSVCLSQRGGTVTWFDALYIDKNENTKNLHFGIDICKKSCYNQRE